MTTTTLAGGIFTLADDLKVTRVGYGAMQLAGPHVFGPPADRAAAVAVLREAVELGITHIDTADFYGPHVTNEIINEALHPYPDDLHIVTKVGAMRDAEGGWPRARSPQQLRDQVHDNLRNLGLDALDAVAGRLEATPMSVALAWLLHRAENILLIPGTSSVAHLRENVAGAGLTIPERELDELNRIAIGDR